MEDDQGMSVVRRSLSTVLTGLLAFGAVLASQAVPAISSVEAATKLEALVIAVPEHEKQAFSQAFRMYEKSHRDIKIQETFIDAGNFETKLLAMTAGGVQPDVMWLWGIHFRNLVPKGLLLPLDKYVDDKFMKNFYTNAVEASTYNGKVYALPGLLGTMAILTNLDLYDEAGVAPLSTKDTWETFLAKAKKLTKDANADGKPEQYGFTWYAYTIRDWTTWLWRNGGDLFDKSLKHLTLNKPESTEALKYLADLTNVHKVTPPGGVLYGEPWTDFTKQKAAMYPSGSWSLSGMKDYKFNVDISPYPSRKNKTVTLDVFFMGVHANSKNPDEAADLAKWMTNTLEGQTQLLATKFGIPSVKEFAQRRFVDPKTPWQEEVFLDALDADQARGIPDVKRWMEIEALLRREFLPVWRGDKSVQSVLSEVTSKVDALLK